MTMQEIKLKIRNFIGTRAELDDIDTSTNDVGARSSFYATDKDIRYIWTGDEWEKEKIGMDNATNAFTTLTYEHHEIHGGSHYFMADYAEFSNAEVVDFTFVTPDTTKWVHLTFNISGSGAFTFEIKEDAVVDVEGTPLTFYNNDRNSDKMTGGVARLGDTYTSEGTTIFHQYSGANKQGGFVTREREIILKQNTAYIFRITNALTTANFITWAAEFYEHTNK